MQIQIYILFLSKAPTPEHPVSPLVSSHMTGPATLTTTAQNKFLSAKLAARQTLNYANVSQIHN